MIKPDKNIVHAWQATPTPLEGKDASFERTMEASEPKGQPANPITGGHP